MSIQNSGAAGGLIGMTVSAAMNAMFTDYLPLARQANYQAFIPPRGIPADPYHAEYGKDQDKF